VSLLNPFLPSLCYLPMERDEKRRPHFFAVFGSSSTPRSSYVGKALPVPYIEKKAKREEREGAILAV